MKEKINLFDKIKEKRFAPGEGVFEPIPEQGIKRFIFLLRTHFWKLISLNLLTVLFSIPIITIPAALCGMNRVLIKLTVEGNCFLWTEFIQEFKANLFKGLPFGLFAAFTLFDAYYFFSLSISTQNGKINIFMAAVGFLFLVFTILFFSYVFVLLPAIDLKNRHIARNAFILMLTEWKINMIILGSVTITAVSVTIGFPYTIFFLTVISISFMQFIICSAINEPLQRRIVKPYLEQDAADN